MLDEASSSHEHEPDDDDDESKDDADVMPSDTVELHVDDPEIVTSLPFDLVRLCLCGIYYYYLI